MARRSGDPTRTRKKILVHATVEFAQMGFAGARVDRIAGRCRLSKNMLYYYFQSKENLFIAVLERMYENLRAEQHDLSVRASDPLHAMQQLIHRTFDALARNPHAIRLMNEENKHHARYIRKSRRMRDLYNPLLNTIQLILERGRCEGVFKSDLDPALVYVTLSSLCYHYLSNQYTLEIALGRDFRSQQAQKMWLDHVTEIVLLSCVADPRLCLSTSKSRR